MAEWSKALDLGSSHFDGVGSNPTAAKLVLSHRGCGSFSPAEQRGREDVPVRSGTARCPRPLGMGDAGGFLPGASKSNCRKLCTWGVQRVLIRASLVRKYSQKYPFGQLCRPLLWLGNCTLSQQGGAGLCGLPCTEVSSGCSHFLQSSQVHFQTLIPLTCVISSAVSFPRLSLLTLCS